MCLVLSIIIVLEMSLSYHLEHQCMVCCASPLHEFSYLLVLYYAVLLVL